MEDKNTIKIMVIDSGGGLSPTITKKAWKVLSIKEYSSTELKSQNNMNQHKDDSKKMNNILSTRHRCKTCY